MDLRKSALYFIGILVLLNGMTDGSILHNTVNTLTPKDKAVFRSEISVSWASDLYICSR
jgi:hypothetical protein